MRLHMSFLGWLAAAALAPSAVAAACAAERAPTPGDYIADGGWGTLRISPAQRGGLPFALDAVGGNFHICGLEGRIVGARATLDVGGGEPACVVRFAPTAEGVAVSGTDVCRHFCGARAGFEGLYLRPAAGCARGALAATRAGFKRSYDGKRYAQALAALEPVPGRCARTLDRYERGGILNDIAIAQYRLGRRDACVRTLAPLAEDAALSDEAIRDAYPPSDADAWLPIVKAARFNLGLCRKKAR